MPDTPDPPDLRLTSNELHSEPMNESNPIDEGLGQESRILLKSIRLPEGEDRIPTNLQAAIRDVVRDHLKQHRLTNREVARQIGYAESTVSEVLNAEDTLSIYIRVEQKSSTDSGLADRIIDALGIRGAKRSKSAVRFIMETLQDTGRLLIVDEAHRVKFSGLEFIRDLADVYGIPVLLLATEEVYLKLTETRQRRGAMFYDQFRRVCHVANLVKGLVGKGGIKRPIFSIDEIRAMFKSDQVRITRDA